LSAGLSADASDAGCRRVGGVSPAYLLAGSADTALMDAFITVSDAAGRVLFRRRATVEEVVTAVRAAEAAEAEAEAAMERIARDRQAFERGEDRSG
jgi:hypothetical protein